MGDTACTVVRDPRLRTLLDVSMLLTGDEATAAVAARRALRRVGDRQQGEQLERALLTAVVRDRRIAQTVPTGTPVDRLDRAQRASVVLAFGPGWDPTSIAEARRTTVRRVRRDVLAALAELPEEDWRRLLHHPRWSAVQPEDLDRADAAADLQLEARRRRRRVLLGVAAVATAVAGALVSVVRVGPAPSATPVTAQVPGLLSWPARGPMIHDGELLAAAVAAWRRGPRPPAGPVYVLYAGQARGGRLVVLQALDPTGSGTVAVVSDRSPSMRVVTVAPIDGPDVPAVVLCCESGGRGRRGAPVPSAQFALVAPDVRRVAVRAALADTPQGRPPFADLTVTAGLSSSWPSPPAGGPVPAIRLVRSDGSEFVGLTTTGRRHLVAVDATPQTPSARWSGLPRDVPLAAVRDDVVWWAQTCRRPHPSVRLVWAGGAPAFPAPVRMELVRCRGVVSAAFLTGFADGSALLDQHRGRADAYAIEFPAPPAFGAGSLLVVGSTAVDRIAAGEHDLPGRVARFALRDAGPVRVFNPAGEELRVR